MRQPSKEEEEEEELNRTLAEMKAQEVAELKRKKKKLLREQRKQRERVELKMDLPGVSIADEGETGMFSLRTIRGHQVRWGWRSEETGDLFGYLEGDGIGCLFSYVVHDHGSWLLSSPINMTW